MFRVVPDQLRISEGWVRCGQCDEVFDANAHLQSLEESVQKPKPIPRPDASLASPESAVAHNQPNPVEAYDWGPVLAPSTSHSAAPDLPDAGALRTTFEAPKFQTDGLSRDGHAENEADAWQGPDVGADSFLDHSPHDLPVFEESMASHHATAQVDDWVYQKQDAKVAASSHSDAAAATGSVEDLKLSFMQPSQSPSWASRYLGNTAMLVICMLLALMLALQFLLLDRDRIAAAFPTLRPVLAGACSAIGCTLSAPRQIEAIAINSSSFTSVKSGVYNLSLTLKNSAVLDLTLPALELTLTDMQDQPVLRRVVLPGEFSGLAIIKAGTELAVSVPIGVRPGVVAEKISGYKLLAFYP